MPIPTGPAPPDSFPRRARRRWPSRHRMRDHPRLDALWMQLGCMRSGGHSQRRRTHSRVVQFRSPVQPTAVCPHATGTAVQAAADPAALARAFPNGGPSLHLLKPFLGHTIGASGLLESVVLASFLRDRKLPPNRSGLHAPPGFTLPDRAARRHRSRGQTLPRHGRAQRPVDHDAIMNPPARSWLCPPAGHGHDRTLWNGG